MSLFAKIAVSLYQGASREKRQFQRGRGWIIESVPDLLARVHGEQDFSSGEPSCSSVKFGITAKIVEGVHLRA